MLNESIPISSDGQNSNRDQLKVVIVGHVDHGKSTLIGRLFYDTGSLPEGRYEQIQSQCQKRGMPFEWSFLVDSLQAEKEQGVTIDTTQIPFRTNYRDYMIIDAPGHKEFLKNMISGSASSDAALLVIDADEGVSEQSRRHGYLLHLLGVDQVGIAINKMDLVDYSKERFEEVRSEYLEYLGHLDVTPAHVIPISASNGSCVAGPSKQMPWYDGPSILDALEDFRPKSRLDNLPLRMPVQDVFKFDDRRIVVGRIETGVLRIGEAIINSPSDKTTKVASFESWPDAAQKGPKIRAMAGESVGITLADQIFVERGSVFSHENTAPILSNVFSAKVFWLSDSPLEAGNLLKLKINTGEYPVEVATIERGLDTQNLSFTSTGSVEKNDVGEITLKTKSLIPLDGFAENPMTGRFVLLDDYLIVGGGIISLNDISDQRRKMLVKSKNLHPTDLGNDLMHRGTTNGHLGGVLWFTGLPSSGKTTLATELQSELLSRGYQAFVLDGDNIRSRLNRDLGFESQDRTENIRRVGEVAALFADAGMIVIAAFISPYEADREQARAASDNRFHCVYIESDVETCELRDPYGLWKRVRKGEITNFTGVDAPYEVPENPELIINTRDDSVDVCVGQLLEYVTTHLVEPVRRSMEMSF